MVGGRELDAGAGGGRDLPPDAVRTGAGGEVGDG